MSDLDRLRGTGGNLFIGPAATTADLLKSINDQLGDIRAAAAEDGRFLDIAEVTISTRRIPSGQISVTVTADLTNAPYADALCTRECSPGHEDPACAVHATRPGAAG